MNKLQMQSKNIVDENIEFIAKRFPNCVTEARDENGKLTKLVDFDMLKQELSHVVIDGDKERYTFVWPDKKQAILTANAPIAKTLRPCKEESVDFDHTQNLYIEGDNLDVLKLLRETYLGKIKMIYIDPPYNTGNDFVYNDDFALDTDEYLERSNQVDDQGNRMVANNDSNGRFHTDWLNMIYPRLKLAKDLLSDDGVIFISIDDHEQENLKKVCNEIYGDSNFIAQVVWERAYSPINLMKNFSTSHDYILCYAKNIELVSCNGLPRNSEANERYSNPDNDPRGVWKSSDLSVGPAIESKVYPITTPTGRVVMPPSGYCWRLDKNKFNEYVKDNRIWFGADGNNVPSIKRFLSEVKQGMTPMTIWKYSDVGHSQEAAQSLKKLFDGKAFFDYPKPVNLIKRCLQLYSNSNSIVLDFFSGSATTAQSVMQLNSEDGGKRKFILVQLPEICGEKSEAHKAGYNNICEIGKERIRRAGLMIASKLAGKDFERRENEIKEAFSNTNDVIKTIDNMRLNKTGENRDYKCPIDTGFRDLKLDSSCMKDVYYSPNNVTQDLLTRFEDNIKEDRTPEDLLFQVMLDMGVMLSTKITKKVICDKEIFIVDDDPDFGEPNLVCCFDKNLTDAVVTEIAKLKPKYAVFRDAGVSSDSVAVNFDQIFETYSKETVRKVL